VVPAITTGGTDAKFFRWKDIPAYGFGLHSTRIPYTEYPLMFHGHNERVDTESLKHGEPEALRSDVGGPLPRVPGLTARARSRARPPLLPVDAAVDLGRQCR
jgi:hypothetical protein